MNNSDHAKIRNIKSKVIAMLQERHTLENHTSKKNLEDNQSSIENPSKYWSDFCSFSDYMLGLSEESFTKLRLHTYHLTGDNYQTYYYGDQDSFMATSNLDSLIRDLPSNFIINEPETGIGFHYPGGRFLSKDILRYQHTLSTFYRNNVLPDLVGKDKKKRYVLEVGGGYGGLAHHFSNIYKNVVYIMIDLPEVLLFSASYLSLLNPQKKIYVYEKKGFKELLQTGALSSYDFVILPNYLLDSLIPLRFDLVINQASFQEMKTSQVETYLDFIKVTCKGVMYSWNRDHQPKNKELSNLTDLLTQRFDLLEVQDWQRSQGKPKTKGRKSLPFILRFLFKNIAISMGLQAKPNKPELPYREYICSQLSTQNQFNKRQK